MKINFKRLRIIALLSVLGFILILPLLWMALTSFKTEAEASLMVPTLWPKEFTLIHYKALFSDSEFVNAIRTTIIVVVLSFLGILVNAMAGFAFEKYKFKGSTFLFYLVLITMMVPAQVTIIPVYLILNGIGLTDTYFGIVLPGLVSGFSIFMYKAFMSTIPNELMEAARIDGTTEFQIFYKIALPMIKPALSIQAIFTFIAGWNSFLWPLILSNSSKYYTISVALNNLKGQHTAKFAFQMAGATVMIIPIILIFSFFQKNIIEGNALSGIK